MSGAALAVCALAALGYWAVVHEPAFYRRAQLELGDRAESACDDLLARAGALASDAQYEGRWHALFAAREINGWLAVDLPRSHPDLLPPQVLAPYVEVQPRHLRVAFRHGEGRFRPVISVDLDAYASEPNQLAVRIRRARLGAVPLPLGQFLDGVSRAASEAGVTLRWLRSGSDPVAVIKLPPPRDGNTSFVIETLDLRDGEIYLAGGTQRSAAPHVADRRVHPAAAGQPTADDESTSDSVQH